MHEVCHISVSIARPPRVVYDFAANPAHLSRWASGLATAPFQVIDGEWVGDAPFGKIRLRFAAKNGLGVMDHDVTLESGQTFHNPMRVVPNGSGSELSFTLLRQAEMTDENFANDQATIQHDLQTLKTLLENM